MTSKQVVIFLVVAFVGIVVVGMGLLAFSLSEIPVRQDSNSNTDLHQTLQGTISGIEPGKDGVQVELQTANLLYNVTISAVQAEIIGSFDQLAPGAEIEISGQEVAGMEPPLIVAEKVIILKSPSLLMDEKWVLASYKEQKPISDHQPTLQFDLDQVSGNTGCNQYGGSYQVHGDGISFDGIYSTEMACQEPQGVMEQERIYLELLRSATGFGMVNGVLTIFVGADPILVFEAQQQSTEAPSSTSVSPTSVSSLVTATSEVVEATQSPDFEPPTGYKEFRDSAAGVSIYIPESWTVAGVINSQYAIFQSYPANKYAGGGGREPADTKCDLNIRPIETRMTDLIQQWESDSQTTIISDQEIILKSGQLGRMFIRDNMGRSVSLVTEINDRAISLICFGNLDPFEGIAQTLNGFEPAVHSPIYQSAEGFKHYMDTETGVAIDMPWHWIVTGIVPGQRAILQSYSENKYIGGEALEVGDTKCDLFIRSDIRADVFVSQMRSDEAITIIAEQELILNSNQTCTRIELNSLGPSILFVTEINGYAVVLTCYGDFAVVDGIAATLDTDG